MSHYDTLRVVPWAEDAVIRSAYRALMRLYHPDTNSDPEAQLRVREITRAFAVLGDPEKRAAYDALPRLGTTMEGAEPGTFTADQQPHPRFRKVGIASVALALALSLAFAMWPESAPRMRPQELPGAPAKSDTTRAASGVDLPAAGKSVVAHANVTPLVAPRTDMQRVPPEPTHHAMLDESKSYTLPAPRPEIARVVVSKAPAPVPTAADRVASGGSESQASASCRPGSSKAANGGCADDRSAQVERLATDSLKQSMEHADWQKRELLLSARNRAAFNRTMCRSSDCVTETYLRQVREITEIMQGRIP